MLWLSHLSSFYSSPGLRSPSRSVSWTPDMQLSLFQNCWHPGLTELPKIPSVCSQFTSYSLPAEHTDHQPECAGFLFGNWSFCHPCCDCYNLPIIFGALRMMGFQTMSASCLSRHLEVFSALQTALPHVASTTLVAQLGPTLCDPWTVARQTPLFRGFSRQEYWTALPFSSPGDLPNPGTETTSLAYPASAGAFFTSWATREAQT